MALPSSSSMFLPVKKKEKEEKPGGLHWQSAKFEFQRSQTPTRFGTKAAGRKGNGSPIDTKLRQSTSPPKKLRSPSKVDSAKLGRRRPQTSDPRSTPNSLSGARSRTRGSTRGHSTEDTVHFGPRPTVPSMPLPHEEGFSLHAQESSEGGSKQTHAIHMTPLDCLYDNIPEQGTAEEDGDIDQAVAAKPATSQGEVDTPGQVNLQQITSAERRKLQNYNRVKSAKASANGGSYSMAYMAMPGGKLAIIRQRRKIAPLNDTIHDPGFGQIVSEIHPPNVHFDRAADFHRPNDSLLVSQSTPDLASALAHSKNSRLRPATAPLQSHSGMHPSLEVDIHQPETRAQILERTETNNSPLPVLDADTNKTRGMSAAQRQASSLCSKEDPFDEAYRQRIYREYLDNSKYNAPPSNRSSTHNHPPPQHHLGPQEVEILVDDIVPGNGVAQLAISSSGSFSEAPHPTMSPMHSQTMLHGTQEVLPFPKKGVRGKFIRGDGSSTQLQPELRTNVPGTIVKSLTSKGSTGPKKRPKDIPYVVHNSVLGWKLTTPARKEQYLNQITEMGYDEDNAYRDASMEVGTTTFPQFSDQLEAYLKERENNRVTLRAKKAERQAIERASIMRRNIQDNLSSSAREMRDRDSTSVSQDNTHASSQLDFAGAAVTPVLAPPNPFLEQQPTIQESLQRFVEEPYLKFVKAKNSDPNANNAINNTSKKFYHSYHTN